MLEQQGSEVSLLTLLDAPFAMPDTHQPAPGEPDEAQPDGAQPDEAELAGRFVADASRSLGWDEADPPDPATATAAEQLGWLAERLDAGDPGAAGDGDLAARLRQRFAVFAAHSRLLAGYRPAGPALRAPALIVGASA